MEVDCMILMIVNTSEKPEALLDFSEEVRLRLGDVLKRKDSDHTWKLIGVGLPTLLETLPNKIHSIYNSEYIFNCLLEPSHPSDKLKSGDILEYVDRS